jgi:23S rRNA pseudouridine1911/1915/1917 synthase
MTEMVVSVEEAGVRLDAFLANHVGSRTVAQRAISEGRVTVDGELRQKRWLVSESEVVRVTLLAPEKREVEPTDVVIPVVWSDSHLAIVDKPVGLVAHPAPGHPTGTLSQILQANHPERDIGLVHRLDRDTSGLLVIAFDDSTLRALRSALQSRDVTREYTALVMGHPRSSEGTVDAAIGRDRNSRTRMSIRTDTPRHAVTHFEVADTFPDATLLRVRLETGRTHQIRVHLAEVGLPVAGDPVYGKAGAWGLSRQFLHAARLSFEHPVTGEALDLTSPLPDDLEVALESARRGDRP